MSRKDSLDSSNENLILDLSFEFAKRIVALHRYLQNEKQEYVLSTQLLRSGTSIGANVNEAQAAQSRKDFLAKLSIASKESRETLYWLRLLSETGYLDIEERHVHSLLEENRSLIKILTSIILTLQGKKQ